jgi:hypothetical protein
MIPSSPGVLLNLGGCAGELFFYGALASTVFFKISAPNPSRPWNPFSKPFEALFSEWLDDFPWFSRPLFRCIALSEIHASKASTISILKRSASNSSCQPPTERLIRSAAFLTTIGPQLDPSFCWGVAYSTGVFTLCLAGVRLFNYLCQ